MRRLDCDICSQDIEEYYDTTVDIIDQNQRLLSMAAGNHHGARLLSAGRVVILRDGVSKRRFVKISAARTERLTEFPPPFPSISNPTSEYCLNLCRRGLPRGPECIGSWQLWIPTKSRAKTVRL